MAALGALWRWVFGVWSLRVPMRRSQTLDLAKTSLRFAVLFSATAILRPGSKRGLGLAACDTLENRLEAACCAAQGVCRVGCVLVLIYHIQRSLHQPSYSRFYADAVQQALS